jgi:LacI family transcriptional regulator
VSTGHLRHRGFVEAMEAAGLTVDPGHVSYADAFTEPQGARACGEVLDHEPRVTAIVAANDRLAMGCYDTLERRGLTCPGDVSIVGFNDMPFIDRLQPPLTSVRVPQREIGAAAADLLLAQLSGDGDPVRQILLEPELVVRASTAPPGP